MDGAQTAYTIMVRGAPAIRELYPIRGRQCPIIGSLSIETNLVERERHRKRSHVFQDALRNLQAMLLRGDLEGVETLSPFREHDGIVFVDAKGQILYVSGVAENLYRKLGYAESLLSHSVSSLGTNEQAFFKALETGRCVELETREGQLIWIRKAIPIFVYRRMWPQVRPTHRLGGVLLTISDITDERQREQELRVKQAMIQEIHHRVKNNLQTIASLLRIQARRVDDEKARAILEEGVNRILSVAVVHEFLSHDEDSIINIREVGQRIVNHTIHGILDPEKGIKLIMRGDGFSLPAQRATACALVINELVQNAVEHGFTARRGGQIIVNLNEDEGMAVIEVNDDGEGLPPDFDLDTSPSLGLRIVQTLVREDLKGTFEITARENGSVGTRAVVRFPKLTISDTEPRGVTPIPLPDSDT
jgi:two-component sensor histidine kinase